MGKSSKRNLTQKRSCASEQFRQKNTSEQIEQAWLIFERAMALRQLLIQQLN